MIPKILGSLFDLALISIIWLHVFTRFQRKKRAGKFLVYLGQPLNRRFGNIVGAIGVLLPSLLLPIVLWKDWAPFLQTPEDVVSTLAGWFLFISIGIYWFMAGLSKVEIREYGLFDFTGLLRWSSIESHGWEGNILVISIKHRSAILDYIPFLEGILSKSINLFWTRRLRIPISLDKLDNIEQLMADRLANIEIETIAAPRVNTKRRAILGGCFIALAIVLYFAWGIYDIFANQIPARSRVDASTSWVTFDDPRFDFTIDYPKPWFADPLPYGNHGDNTAKAIISAFGDGSVTIRMLDSQVQIDLSQLIEKQHKDEQTRAAEFQRKVTFESVSLLPTALDGVTALIGDYKTQDSGNTILDIVFQSNPLQVTDLAFQVNGRNYVIIFEPSISADPHFEIIYRRMLQSIKFRK